jgi:antitoxin ParD1/3/4
MESISLQGFAFACPTQCNKVFYTITHFCYTMASMGDRAMKPAGQMTLTLTSELEQFVRDEVRRGAFASSSEYVRDLVREKYMQERDRAAKLKALDASLARGIADAEAGRAMPLDEAFKKLRAELELPEQSRE